MTITDIVNDDRLAVSILEAARLIGRGGRRLKRKKGKGYRYQYEGASSIHEMIADRKLDAVKDGGRTLILMASIRRHIESLPRVAPKSKESAT